MRYACERDADGWIVRGPDGARVRWHGMNTGPLLLADDELGALCQALLGVPLAAAEALAAVELRRAAAGSSAEPALILHSTSPEKRTFEGELEALARGRSPYDSTTHAETRATLFARRGDLLVGRTGPWRDAVECEDLSGLRLPGTDYYYLSHALLELAARRPAALAGIVAFVRARPRLVVRVYALEPAMLVFLLWLRRAAGVDALVVDANLGAVTRAWNRKSILYPTVAAAAALPTGGDAQELLAAESALSPLARLLGAAAPSLPGYTVAREGVDRAEFTARVIQAAALLRDRHGLRRGCLKASVGGGGTRITPRIALEDTALLARLADAAHAYEDDHVLEADVTYATTVIGDRSVALAPSAHIRGGRVAPGFTLQLTRGTTWIGNIYFDASTAAELGVSPAICERIDRTMHALHRGFAALGGLAIGGVDFAVGHIGDDIHRRPVLAMQDPNLSFNGAECLRAYLDARPGASHGATLVVRPAAGVDLVTLRAACRRHDHDHDHDHDHHDNVTDADADALGVVPERSAMLVVRGERPREVGERLFALAARLHAAGLLLA